MKTDVKVQINSLEALERLIGGDSNLEFELRARIVHEFTKRHLKTIAVESVVKDAHKAVTEELEASLFNKVRSGWTEVHVLKPSVKEGFLKEVRKAIDNQFDILVAKELSLDSTRIKITQLLEKQSDYIIAELTNENLEGRLEKMVDFKIKKRLGLK